jgi:hypothetical protein
MKREFSIAERINVEISGELSNDCISFLKKIYENFDEKCETPKFILKVVVTDEIPKIKKKYSLGKDGYFDEKTLILSSGHFFIRSQDNILKVGIPTKVKRGRIPFKRVTPGRHITDEIIEPLLQIILQRYDATFVHASSIYENGKVSVIMGWRGTGKTNAILKDFEKKEIWSDDLSIIDSEGFVYPYLRPIRLYSYNLPLIDKSYLKTHKLNLKKYITPPWKPVHYLSLQTKSETKKAPMGEMIFLNDKKTRTLAQDSENIMEFEQIFFKNYQIMLNQSRIFKSRPNVKKIIDEALIKAKIKY